MGGCGSKQKKNKGRGARASARGPQPASLYVDARNPQRGKKSSSVLRFGDGQINAAFEERRNSSSGLNFDPVAQRQSSHNSVSSLRSSSVPLLHHSPSPVSKRDSAKRYEGIGEPKRIVSAKKEKARSSKARVDQMTLPPPPPPPPDEFEFSKNSVVAKTEDELTYIDYTVVPLLLRAQMDYEDANRFGMILKQKYSPQRIRNLMNNPFELFTALEAERIAATNDFKFKVVEDQFWKQNQTDDSGKDRTSFVYYREESPSVTKRSSPNNRASYDKVRGNVRLSSRRASVKNEFGQHRSLSKGEKDDFQIDMNVVRRSLKMLTEAGDFGGPSQTSNSNVNRRERPYDDLTI